MLISRRDRFCGEAIGVSERLWELVALGVSGDCALAVSGIHLLELQVRREEIAHFGPQVDAIALGLLLAAEVHICLLKRIDLRLHVAKLIGHAFILHLLVGCLKVLERSRSKCPPRSEFKVPCERDFEEWSVFCVSFLCFFPNGF